MSMALESQVPPNSAGEISPRTSTQSSRPFHHRVWSNLSGKDRPWIGWRQSACAIIFASCQSSIDVWHGYMRGFFTHLSQRRAQCFGHLHSSCLGIPLPRMGTWGYLCTYVIILCRPSVRSQNLLPVCFLAIVSLEKMFDWGGEQLAMYCGPDLGDLIIITLNKYVRLISPSLTTLSPHSQCRRSYPCNHPSFSMRVCVPY
jgi:hypothetical protein